MNQAQTKNPVRTAIEISVNLILVFVIVAWCLQILRPFISIIMWGVIIAVATHTPFLWLRKALGGSNKLAVMIFVLLGLSVIIIPAWMFAGSLIESEQGLRASLQSGEFKIPPPNENVKDWPLVGEKLYANWSASASNFGDWLSEHSDQVKSIARTALSTVAGIGLSILQFVISTLIAAAMLANDQAGIAGIRRFCHRLVGDQDKEMLQLATATIRSVTVGVLGIAFIQALLGGAGMMVVGVPAAGVWALIILVVAIAQLPPLLVLLPAAIYVFSVESTTVAVVFTVWSVLVSFADALLKPLLLGRGVEAPMPVILLGAIGGMLMSGIIGLFLGAVILALGYKLFQTWLNGAEEVPETP